MAGMMSETYVLQAISNGLQTIQQNPGLLNDILDALNDQERMSAVTYFMNPQTKIIVAPGFPNQQSQFPFIGVTVAEENQSIGDQGIGLMFDRNDNGDGTWTDVKAVPFEGTIKATIYTPNPDLIIWLSAICSWALISNYDFFYETAGMWEVQCGLGDYEPSPQYLPIFVFARGAYLKGKWNKTFKSIVRPVTSSLTTGTFNDLTTFNNS